MTLETTTLAVLAQVEALAPSATGKEVVYLAKAVEAARAEDPAGIDISAARTALLARIETLAPNAGANDLVYLGKAQEALTGGRHVVVDHLMTVGNATIGGDLMVSGDTVTVDTPTVQVADNVMVLNHGETGAGVTPGEAGVTVDRGTEEDYRFVFRERDDAFVIGKTGSEQAMATRQDAPPVHALPAWDGSARRYVGTGLTWEGGLLRYPAAPYAVATATIGAAHTLDLTAGAYQALSLTDDTVITVPEPPAGRGYSVTLKLIQGTTGGHVPTLQKADGTTTRWLGGEAPTWQTAPRTADLVVLTHDGADLFAAHVGDLIVGSAGGDPHWAQVVLLLDGIGDDGATVIPDRSRFGRAVTAHGDARISAAQSKWGGSSIVFDGSAASLTLGGGADFTLGTQDFTVETWVYPTFSSGLGFLFDTRPSGSSGTSHRLIVGFYQGSLGFYIHANGSNRTSSSPVTVVPVNTWHHVAVSRASGQTRLFLNGAQVGVPWADATSYAAPGANRPIIGDAGDAPGSRRFKGYIQDYRVTVGVARYTASFTPPAGPLPVG